MYSNDDVLPPSGDVGFDQDDWRGVEEAKNVASLTGHPAWPVVLKILAEVEAELLQKVSTSDAPKDVIRAADAWKMFRFAKQIVEQAPARAEAVLEATFGAAGEVKKWEDLKLEEALSRVPYSTASLI